MRILFSSARCAVAAVAALSLAAWAAAPTHAQAPQFFFVQQGATPAGPADGITALEVTAGGTLSLSVWYRFDPVAPAGFDYGILSLFVGYDRAAAAGPEATPLDSRLSLVSASGVTGAAHAPIATSDPSGGSDPFGQPSGSARPFGVGTAFQVGTVDGGGNPVPYTGTGATPVRLLDLTLSASGLPAGESADLVIYSSGDPAAADLSTYIDGQAAGAPLRVQPAGSTTLRVTGTSAAAVPEPSAAGLLASGLASAAVVAARRRRGRSTQPCRSG